MMKNDFDHLLELPGAPEEREWIKERLETLSVRESYVLAAAAMRHPPEDTSEAVDCLHTLDDYEICFPAGSYEELGALYLRQNSHIPEEALPYVNLERLGQVYEDEHPGLFVGQCYVAYPAQPSASSCQENKLPLLWDDDWSVKLKLASPAVPEGVWLRLPGRDGKMIKESDEVILALDELQTGSLEECTLLDAKCILPEAGDLMKQYNSVTELVRDGDNLGIVLEEQGQGEAHWMEKFSAALEYEDCRTLRFALDISQNLSCYEWISSEGLADFAADRLRKEGVSDEMIRSGCIDLERYAEDLLETSEYMITKDESAYVTRNGREFIREFTAEQAPPVEHSVETTQQEQGGMTMQ